MTRRVNQVELILLTVVGRVVHAHGLAFNRDAALSFDIHAIEQLFGHVALRNRSREFENTVRKRRLAVVDMGDDAEISNKARIGCHDVLYVPSVSRE